MAITIFDHLKGVTSTKTKWDTLSDADKKSWDDYMITRWLSMKLEYVEYLNEIQVYRSAGLQGKEYYNLLYHTLPKNYSYFKYIKRPRTFELKKQLLEFFSSVYKVSHRESLDMIYIFCKLNLHEEFEDLMTKHGLQEETKKELRKEMFDGK